MKKEIITQNTLKICIAQIGKIYFLRRDVMVIADRCD